MPVGPKDIRIIRTDSLVDMGTPASTDQVIIRDVTDGVLKYAQVSDVGITDHGGLAGLADFTADHGTSHDSHDHSTAMSTVVLNDLSDLTITTPSTADIVYYDGAGWVNQALAASDIQSGTFADARIAESNVTQHQAALSITESQISNLTHYTTSDFNTDFAASNLQALSNVTVTSVTNDEVLAWSGTAWINQTAAEAGLATDTHVHDTADVTTGTFANARISEASVTQHQAALSITESQISNLDHLTIEEVQDNLGTSFIVGGTNLTATYSDVGNTLTLDVDSHSHTEAQISDLDHYTTTDFTTDHNAVSGGHVTNGNTHDHSGGDGAQIDHGSLSGRTDNDHPQYQDIVYHGATAGTARPSVLGRVMWVGSVEPTNIATDDMWLDTDDSSIAVTTAHNDLSGLTTGNPHTQYLQSNGATQLTGVLEEAVTTIGNSGATPTVDWNNAPIQTMTLTANATVSFSNLPTAGGSLVLVLTQDGTGSRTVTWPVVVEWPGGTAPTLSTAANSVDVITFITASGGSVVYGFASGLGMA